MSWLFSRALVEEYSAAHCSGGALSAPSSWSPTPQAFLPPDRMTAFSRPSRFGMTFAALTEPLGAELLMWFQAASRARTSAWPEKEPVSAASDPACGLTWRASLARFDPASRSWKTAQLCLLGDSELSSVIWPRSGMTAAGQCWELPTLARTTAANDSGLLPTPLASNTKANHMRSNGRPARSYWPTPTASEHTGPGHAAQGGLNLRTAVANWPTPTVCGNYNRKGASATSGDGLATAVLKVATPTARDWRSGKASQATHDKNSRPLSEQIGGSLNPTWVEWLMGWPLGWTDLKPLATDKSHCAQPAHGGC